MHKEYFNRKLKGLLLHEASVEGVNCVTVSLYITKKARVCANTSCLVECGAEVDFTPERAA